LPVIAGFIDRDAKKPGLELGVSLERSEIFDNRQENLLADLLDIFPGEVVSKLGHEAGCGSIMKVKELIPGVRLASLAAIEQGGFGF
jgi:hypothetical protein